MTRKSISIHVGEGHKFCACCSTVKELGHFYKRDARTHDSYCKECRLKLNREARAGFKWHEPSLEAKGRHRDYFPNRTMLANIVSAWLHVSDVHPAEGYGRLGPFDRFVGWLTECFVDGQEGFASEHDGVVATFVIVNDQRGRLTLHVGGQRMFGFYVERGKTPMPSTGLGVFMPDFTAGMLQDLPDPTDGREVRERRGKWARSRYIGVRQKSASTWAAYYRFNDTILYLGTFESDVEAAKAYDEQARKNGKKTNF